MSAWAEAKTADGRTYYWNKETKVTRWDPPEGFEPSATPATPAAPLGPAAERAADWAEAKTPEGKTYYYNRTTKVTSWSLPESVRAEREKQSQQNGFVAGGGGDRFGGRDDRRDDRGHGLPQKPSFDDGPRGSRGDRGDRVDRGDRGGGGGGMPWERRDRDEPMGGFRGPMPVKNDEPEYGSHEAAEEAFFKLLKRNNITPDTEWQDALRTVIRDREYRAIKDPQERKVAFEKYCVQVRAEQKGKEKERREKIREEFRRMLSTHDEIQHYTRWKTARPIIEREAVFKSAGDEDEKRRIFDEYILELKKHHVQDEATKRNTAIAELENMLKVLIIDANTTWAEAEDKVMGNERFVTDETFQALHKFDVFQAFDYHMKALDQLANDALQKQKRNKHRRHRQARDAYKQLLSEKLREGNIKAGSKWQDIFPQIKEDERFLGYLGIPGSDPLDLFWDVVEDEERKLRSKRNDALDVLEEERWEMTLDTAFDDFAGLMKSHPRTANLREDEVQMIFDRLMEKIKRRADEDKAGLERQRKAMIEDIRVAMKKKDIRVDDTYEIVAKELSSSRAWEAADDDLRRRAFDKHMLRLKEKEEERHQRRERDRSRDYRNGGVSRRDDRERDRDRRHRTRTPEVDAYEADRRKAQEARERSYRKASFGFSPARDRERDRYISDDRGPHLPRRPVDTYDPRDRRLERPISRERATAPYMSRADPRDKGMRSLDYGDEDAVGSRPPSVRKRRESDASGRTSKRVKRDGEGEEVKKATKDEEVAMQSGSEEGEIEEVERGNTE